MHVGLNLRLGNWLNASGTGFIDADSAPLVESVLLKDHSSIVYREALRDSAPGLTVTLDDLYERSFELQDQFVALRMQEHGNFKSGELCTYYYP